MSMLAPRFALKYAIAAIALPLALSAPVHGAAGAGPSTSTSGSFKSGFSSQRSSPPSKGSFGSFGKRSSSSSSSSSSAASPGRGGGGFGSFGRSAPSDTRRSDSALSRKLDRDASEARALRTLEARRAAQAARNAPPPPAYGQAPREQPGYGPAPRSQPDYGQVQRPARQGSGLGPIIAGAVIANAAANAHAQRNSGQAANQQPPAPLPPPTWNGGVGSVNAGAAGAAAQPVPAPAQAGPKAAQGGGTVFGTIVTLALLAALGWGVYKLVKRRRRGAAKPNYSFERN